MAIEKWAVLFVTGDDLHDQPASCFNCTSFYPRQKTCRILGPSIRIDRVAVVPHVYTPVCGLQDPGKPEITNEPVYLSSLNGEAKADEVGLEWAEGMGVNCSAVYGGADCSHLKMDDCQLLKMPVAPSDCCAAHDGDHMEWREAQRLLQPGVLLRIGRMIGSK